MKVRELIERLSTLPDGMQVMLDGCNWELDLVERVGSPDLQPWVTLVSTQDRQHRAVMERLRQEAATSDKPELM